MSPDSIEISLDKVTKANASCPTAHRVAVRGHGTAGTVTRMIMPLQPHRGVVDVWAEGQRNRSAASLLNHLK